MIRTRTKLKIYLTGLTFIAFPFFLAMTLLMTSTLTMRIHQWVQNKFEEKITGLGGTVIKKGKLEFSLRNKIIFTFRDYEIVFPFSSWNEYVESHSKKMLQEKMAKDISSGPLSSFYVWMEPEVKNMEINFKSNEDENFITLRQLNFNLKDPSAYIFNVQEVSVFDQLKLSETEFVIPKNQSGSFNFSFYSPGNSQEFSMNFEGQLSLEPSLQLMTSGSMHPVKDKNLASPIHIQLDIKRDENDSSVINTSFVLQALNQPCSLFPDVLPKTFKTHLDELVFDGNFDLAMKFQGNILDRSSYQISFDPLQMNCHPVSYPKSLSMGEWPISDQTFRSYLKKEPIQNRSKHPLEPFVSIHALPKELAAAFISSEDMGFFMHQGIDVAEIQVAIQEALQGKRFRGASTITMQVIKNLILGGEKTLSRKVQEIILAMTIEKYIPKEWILETYLNIIEFGFDVVGIQSASQFYFNQAPEKLRLEESIFLASLLPNPVQFHRAVCEKGSGAMKQSMNIILDRMYDTKKIDAMTYHLSKDFNLIDTTLKDRQEEICHKFSDEKHLNISSKREMDQLGDEKL